MFGSRLVKPLYGRWMHIGTMTSEGLPIPTNSILPKGTWLAHHPNNEFVAQLASGYAVGFMTQDISELGHTSIQAFQDRILGLQDLPIKRGQAISVRVMDAGGEIEFEGKGAAVPGNLVCTTGTGAISATTPVKAELSFFNGCIRLAQAGDMVQLIMEQSNLVPEKVGDVRIRVKACGAYLK